MFELLLKRNPNLSVVNALRICECKITREKKTKRGTERSILDFFLVCDQILPLVSRMVVDEKGEIALTKYRRRNIVKTDHHMLKIELDLTFHNEKKHEQTDMFNLLNKVCQQNFGEKTTNTNVFSKCFESDESINIQFKRWHRRLVKALHRSFREIRIKDDQKKQSQVDILLNKKRVLLKKKELEKKDKIEFKNLNDHIVKECEDMEYQKLTKVLGSIESDSGDTNTTNIWKEMRRAFPKKTKPMPTGMKNVEGKVLTNPEEKKKVILDHLKHRMRKRTAKK